VWAFLALLLVSIFGVRAIALSTRLLATVLVLSLIVVLLFDTASLMDPGAGVVDWSGFDPSGLFVSGIGGAAALCLAALMGVEAPASFAEESNDDRAVTTSVFAGVLFLSIVYAVAAWAMGIAVGPAQVAAVAGDPAGGLPFSVLERVGGFMTPATQTMLIFAIITSLLAFHNVIARYAFAMAREGVLPHALARSSSGTRVNAPVGGSLLQTAIAVIVVAVFVLGGADPVAGLFTWLSTLGALGLLCLLIAASVAAMAYFARGVRVNAWTSVVAPLLGIVLGTVVLGAMVVNVDSLLGADPGSLRPYLLPVIVTAAALGGVLWAGHLRRTRPDVYDGVSQGRPDAHAVPDDVGVIF
jgi:amino acid transporter